MAVLIFVQFVPQTTTAAANGSAQPPSEPFQNTSQAITSTRFTTLDPKRIGIDFVHRPDFELQAELLVGDSLVGGGVCIGDYDGDRLPDLVLTRPVGGLRLYRNVGDFRFMDVTQSAGLGDDKMWATGASFADLDSDLDLFVCGYVVPNRLYINQGNGRFVERGRQAGLCRPAK